MKNEISREEYDPEGWFNDGVIVREDVEKLCHTLMYYPYGGIV